MCTYSVPKTRCITCNTYVESNVATHNYNFQDAIIIIQYMILNSCEFTCVLHKHVTNQLQKFTVNRNPTRVFGKSQNSSNLNKKANPLNQFWTFWFEYRRSESFKIVMSQSFSRKILLILEIKMKKKTQFYIFTKLHPIKKTINFFWWII